MMTKFSLDKDFFSSPLLNNIGLSAIHDFITSTWLNAGIIVLPKGGSNELISLIDKLPSKFRNRWIEALEHGKNCEIDSEWWEFCTYESFESLCSLNKHFSTALSDDAVSYVLCGDDSLKKSCQETGFEILGAGVCSESLNLGNAITMSKADILESETPSSIWNSRLKLLAQHSKKISIIDRYFFESIWRAAETNSIDYSLKNLLTFLAELKKKFNITIISHGGEKNSAFHTAVHGCFYSKIYKNPILKQPINNLTLISASETFFKRESHDRFIGFDKHICQIGNGMRILGSTPIPRSTYHAKFDRLGELSRREASSRSREFKLWEERF